MTMSNKISTRDIAIWADDEGGIWEMMRHGIGQTFEDADLEVLWYQAEELMEKIQNTLSAAWDGTSEDEAEND